MPLRLSLSHSVSQLAQSVIVEDDAGCVMAFVPAHRSVKFAPLSAGYPTLMPAPQLRLRPPVLAA